VSAPEGFSYLWQPGGEKTKDIIAYANNPGDSVTVTLTSITGCKTTLSTKLYPTHTKAKFNVNDSVSCVNKSINFSDFSTSTNISTNAAIPIVQWDWRFGDGQIGSGATVTHTYSSAGTYTAHLVVTNQTGCMDSITKIITVNALPTVSATSNSTLLCVGESATLTAVGANTYSWNPGSIGANITISPTVTTNYTVTGTNANGCVSAAIVTQSVDLCANGVATQGVNYFTPNIYPNPTKGLFTIELNANTQIIITNILGQEILNEKRNAGKQLFDIQNQVNGIYFVKIGLLIKKIIKE
jgi:PKD repeat protein